MRVAVVGAGLAGLTAAAALAAGGAEPTVFDARERVGGRTFGIPVGVTFADGGAAYIGDRHTAVLELMAEHGLATVPTTMAGDSRFRLETGAVSTAPTRFPPLSAVALGELFEHLQTLVEQIDPVAPWQSPDAARWDRLPVAKWAEDTVRHPDALRFLPLFLGEMMAADPVDVSVLHAAFYLRSGGGLRYLNAFEGGAQQWRVDGGAHRLAEAVAGRLGFDRLRLGTRVLRIAQDAGGADVTHTSGTERFDTVVVALPPTLAQALDYTPALRSPRATARTGPGCAVKVHLIYPAPLWREHGLSGWSVSSAGPLLSTVDDSPPDGSAGVLTGFVTGRAAHRMSALPPGERRAAALAHVSELFPELPEPHAVHVTDWLADPDSRGCYAALFGLGDWAALGPGLRTPHGRIHWAGTETSAEFFGLMEGAIRSGRRAAGEVLHGEPHAGGQL
jgi:monoamine oxidase